MPTEPHLLVVDDQYGVRRLIHELFSQAGYRVTLASNGREALDQVQANPPTLVLLDMRMPVMDGMEALRLLKQMRPDLRCIMMTAVEDEEQINQAMAAGAQACIAKPFDIFALRELVEGVLGKEGIP